MSQKNVKTEDVASVVTTSLNELSLKNFNLENCNKIPLDILESDYLQAKMRGTIDAFLDKKMIVPIITDGGRMIYKLMDHSTKSSFEVYLSTRLVGPDGVPTRPKVVNYLKNEKGYNKTTPEMYVQWMLNKRKERAIVDPRYGDNEKLKSFIDNVQKDLETLTFVI